MLASSNRRCKAFVPQKFRENICAECFQVKNDHAKASLTSTSSEALNPSAAATTTTTTTATTGRIATMTMTPGRSLAKPVVEDSTPSFATPPRTTAAAAAATAATAAAAASAQAPATTTATATPGANGCLVCSKQVYHMEKVEADKKVYHKWCFKCSECKKTLNAGNYASLHGKLFCKPHFKQLFKLKGNYDEGFGASQRKHDWVKGGSPATGNDSDIMEIEAPVVSNTPTAATPAASVTVATASVTKPAAAVTSTSVASAAVPEFTISTRSTAGPSTPAKTSVAAVAASFNTTTSTAASSSTSNTVFTPKRATSVVELVEKHKSQAAGSVPTTPATPSRTTPIDIARTRSVSQLVTERQQPSTPSTPLFTKRVASTTSITGTTTDSPSALASLGVVVKVCQKFSPHAFQKGRCMNCRRPETEHLGVPSSEADTTTTTTLETAVPATTTTTTAKQSTSATTTAEVPTVFAPTAAPKVTTTSTTVTVTPVSSATAEPVAQESISFAAAMAAFNGSPKKDAVAEHNASKAATKPAVTVPVLASPLPLDDGEELTGASNTDEIEITATAATAEDEDPRDAFVRSTSFQIMWQGSFNNLQNNPEVKSMLKAFPRPRDSTDSLYRGMALEDPASNRGSSVDVLRAKQNKTASRAHLIAGSSILGLVGTRSIPEEASAAPAAPTPATTATSAKKVVTRSETEATIDLSMFDAVAPVAQMLLPRSETEATIDLSMFDEKPQTTTTTAATTTTATKKVTRSETEATIDLSMFDAEAPAAPMLLTRSETEATIDLSMFDADGEEITADTKRSARVSAVSEGTTFDIDELRQFDPEIEVENTSARTSFSEYPTALGKKFSTVSIDMSMFDEGRVTSRRTSECLGDTENSPPKRRGSSVRFSQAEIICYVKEAGLSDITNSGNTDNTCRSRRRSSTQTIDLSMFEENENENTPTSTTSATTTTSTTTATPNNNFLPTIAETANKTPKETPKGFYKTPRHSTASINLSMFDETEDEEESESEGKENESSTDSMLRRQSTTISFAVFDNDSLSIEV